MVIKIDVFKARQYASTLTGISRSALPVAIRSALNSTAFDVKKNTLPRSADAAFTNRSPNFFKANSRVEMATGFDIGKMQAKAGMIETGLKGDNNYAVHDLEQQEHGGTISNKSFIPMNTARGGSNAKNVRPANRLSVINKIIDYRKAKGVNDKQKFIKSVIFAGIGGYVLGKFGEKLMLWRVNSLNKTKSGSFKLTPLYTYQSKRTIHVSPSSFMKKAAETSHAKLASFFIKEAEKQISKAIKK